jgi:hypothetical protein
VNVIKAILAFVVSGLLARAMMGYTAIRAPLQETTATTPAKEEQCAHQAQNAFEGHTAEPLRSLYSFTDHYSTESARCVVEINYKKEVDRKLYDANENIGLGQLRLLPNGNISVCWVSDLSGHHNQCGSISAYGALLKRYYGMQE